MEDLFADFWNTVKEYVPAKERQTAADHIVSNLIDNGADDNILFALRGCDKHMKDAGEEQLEDTDSDWNEEDDDDSWEY